MSRNPLALRLLQSLAVIAGSIAMSQAIAADTLEDLKQQFVGDWVLVSYVQFPAQGEPVDMQYIGRLSYDAFGNMSGLGMPRDLPARAAAGDGPVTGGFAYWGRVSYDPATQRVIHHVEGAPMIPRWVGQDNIRFYEFVDDLLKLSLRDDTGRTTATLTWRRLR